jgi:hypothetical protein
MKFLVCKKASIEKNSPSFIKACQYDIIYEYVFHNFLQLHLQKFTTKF